MPRFFVRGLDPAGREQTRRVDAATGEAALALLAGEGWQKLELLTDAIFGSVPTPEVERRHAEADRYLPVADQLQFDRYGIWWPVWRALKKYAWLLFFLAIWVSWRLVWSSPWGVWDFLLVLGSVSG